MLNITVGRQLRLLLLSGGKCYFGNPKHAHQLEALLCNLGVLFVGVLIIRALAFRVYMRAPDCWKLSFEF